jgi:predicted oxidoreductase (fatty acid repression mutant protein)
MVTMNEITYDRFESTSGGKSRVAYVARKSSANERGFASVLVFTADDNDRFQKADFEKIVASFRYFSAGSAGSVQGEEVPGTNG